MGLEKLDTSGMQAAAKEFRNSIEQLSKSKTNIKQINTDIIEEWVGKSSNAYQKQFKILMKKIDDIEDDLYEFYDAIIEAEEAFIDTDISISKAIERK